MSATESRRHTHMGIDDSGSDGIAMDDAVLPDNHVRCWRHMECRWQEQAEPGFVVAI